MNRNNLLTVKRHQAQATRNVFGPLTTPVRKLRTLQAATFFNTYALTLDENARLITLNHWRNQCGFRMMPAHRHE